MARRRGVSDLELKAVLRAEIASSIGHMSGDIASQRAKAMDFYLGDMSKHLPVPEGRSQAVSTDVQDVIEGLMPSLMEIFTGGDEVARFEPVGPEDEEAAAQETDYVNHVFYQENDGFVVLYETIKDALLSKTGVIKRWAEEVEETKKEHYRGLTLEGRAFVLAQDGIAVLEEEQRPDGLFDVEATVTRKVTRIKVAAVPPEEFLVSRDARRGQPIRFACHKTKKTQSDLIEMGLPRAKVEKLETYTGSQNEETQARDTTLEESEQNDAAEVNRAMRPIEVYECYLRVDRDGDGIAELVKVMTSRDGSIILSEEDCDEIPFSIGSPIMQPHRIIGRSMADLILDIQLIKTAVLRQLLDNMYNANNGVTEVPEEAMNENTLEDLLTRRPNGFVRTKGVGGMLRPIETIPLNAHAIPLLEMMDGARETRTGITRYNQGLDAGSLNKTASGISQIMSQAQMRIRLIARILSETLVKDMMIGLHGLIVKHDRVKKTIRLRNKWVEIDPTDWRERNDMTISVGLGTGSREAQVASLSHLIGLQAEAVKMQGGANGPLITLPNLHAAFKKLVESMGFKNADQFVSEPNPQQQPEQKPDPKMVEVQLRDRREGEKNQIAAKKVENEATIAAGELQLKARELEIQQRQAEVGEFQAVEQARAGRDGLDLERARVADGQSARREERDHAQAMKQTEMQPQADTAQTAQMVAETLQRIVASQDQTAQAIIQGQQELVRIAKAPRRIAKGPKGEKIGVPVLE